MARDDKPASSKPSVPPGRRPSVLPQRPTKLGRFDVLGKIAVGGMASIYLGRDSAGGPASSRGGEGAVVALKVMKPEISEDDELVRMFVDEASLLAKLDHPNIVHTIDFGVEGSQRYIAMELLLGMPLSSVVEQCTSRSLRLDPDLVAFVGARIGEGLHHAHELCDDNGKSLSLIHRDVNPANVFVSFEGSVKLFDFGMARTAVRTTSQTQPGVVKGKLPYLAPEQIMQLPLDRRADIFGLGTSLWELLTMQRLFHRSTDVETVRAVHVGPIPDVRTIVPEVPARLAAVVSKALERNREHRYQTAEELANALSEIASPRAANAPARLGAMLDSLFPNERKRQAGWLKPAISGGGGSKAPPPMK